MNEDLFLNLLPLLKQDSIINDPFSFESSENLT